jgi:hypothetical protein
MLSPQPKCADHLQLHHRGGTMSLSFPEKVEDFACIKNAVPAYI